MSAILLVARAEARRRRAALLGLALIVALVGTAVLGSVAGARRSASALDRFQDATDARDGRAFAFVLGADVGEDAGVRGGGARRGRGRSGDRSSTGPTRPSRSTPASWPRPTTSSSGRSTGPCCSTAACPIPMPPTRWSSASWPSTTSGSTRVTACRSTRSATRTAPPWPRTTSWASTARGLDLTVVGEVRVHRGAAGQRRRGRARSPSPRRRSWPSTRTRPAPSASSPAPATTPAAGRPMPR